MRVVVLALCLTTFPLVAHAAEAPARQIPPPALDEQAGKTGSETAVLAGGCYWGMQGFFEHIKGVENVVAGYSGDFTTHDADSLITTPTPAESVKITYDPSKISYGKILQIYFSVAHDPTERDRQGPDVGPQYRSNIFYGSDEQKQIAEAYIKQLDTAGLYPSPIVTRVDRFQKFVAAKPSEQDVMRVHADMAYVVAYDLPKLPEIKRLFPELYVEPGLTYSD